MTDKINQQSNKPKWPNKLKSYLAGLVIASAVAGGLSSCDEKDWGSGIGKGEKTEQLATKSLADSCWREIIKFLRNTDGSWLRVDELDKWPIIVEKWPNYIIMILAKFSPGPAYNIVKMLDSGDIEFSYTYTYNTLKFELMGDNLKEWWLQTTADYAKVYQELIDIFVAANAKKASQ